MIIQCLIIIYVCGYTRDIFKFGNGVHLRRNHLRILCESIFVFSHSGSHGRENGLVVALWRHVVRHLVRRYGMWRNMRMTSSNDHSLLRIIMMTVLWWNVVWSVSSLHVHLVITFSRVCIFFFGNFSRS